MCVCVCVCVCMCVHACVFVCVCSRARVPACMRACVRSCVCVLLVSKLSETTNAGTIDVRVNTNNSNEKHKVDEH